MRPLLAASVFALSAGALAAGCKVPDARAWNLNEIHDESTHHRYTGRIESDTEYFFRHDVAGSIAVGNLQFEDKTPIAVPDPSTTCLENLVALEDYGESNPRVFGMQIEWASRLAASDPWRLTRERAADILGRAGKRLSAGIPEGLPAGSVPSGPDAVSESLAGLLRASRPVLDHASRLTPTERLDLESACQVVLGLTLDIDGARRLLRATVDLVAAVGSGKTAAAPLTALVLDLEKRCVRLGIAAALRDPEPIVRAAAVEAAVHTAGTGILDPILLQLQREPSPEVIVAVMEMVREMGLPEGPIHGEIEGPQLSPEQARRARLAAIYNLLNRAEGWVRVSAMQTLAKVSGSGIHSLREEDWQTWWTTLAEKREP